MKPRSIVAAILLVSVLLRSVPARADQEKTVQWNENWHRVRVIELLDILALTVASTLISIGPSAKEAHWKGPILLDKPLRSLFKATTRAGQASAAGISDHLYKGMVLAPYIIDNYIAALGVHQNADVALQMTLIDMQSLGLSGVITLASEHATGRQRPYVSGCVSPTGVDKVGYNECGGADDFKSFYSGHAAAMFTMAGLTCAHHQHLPLYGGGVADALACAVMVGLAGVGSAARVVADRHWASDVLLGAAVGLVNGYVLPSWWHYGFGGSGKTPLPTTVKTSFGTLVPMPQVYDRGAGIGIAVF